MLNGIILDGVERSSTAGQTIYRSDVDYDAIASHHREVVQRWHGFKPHEKEAYSNQAEFEAKEGAQDPRAPDLAPAKNLSLLRKEVGARLNKANLLQLLPLDALDFVGALLELAESLENTADIQDTYKLRKLATGTSKNAGIKTEEALRIKSCFTQGRELFLAGQQGSLMVKPLNFFYALTAYSYGVILLNNPLRYRKDMIPGSHGMSYLPNDIKAQFGGDSARGTFSDLVTAFPTHLIKTPHLDFSIDCTSSIIEFHKIHFNVGLGELLGMIPEMADYYTLTTGRQSRCYRLEVTSAKDPRSLAWEFHIGDGEARPPASSLDDAFPGFDRGERHGKAIVTIPTSKASTLNACLYTDVRGGLWYIDNPFSPVILPEIAVHFLITNIYSNIMRYRPDEWGSVLANEMSSSDSLITRKYFSTFQRKFLVSILRSVSRYLPYAASI